MTDKWQVILLCLRSRLLISILAIGSDLLLPDHNADAYRHDLLNSSHLLDEAQSIPDHIILKLTSAFMRWDAQYFLAIAHENRYLKEEMLAFFPLFPLVIRNVAFTLQSLLSSLFLVDICLLSALVIGAFVINLICFVIAGLFLFELTNFMFQSKTISLQVVQFFVFNPASIFFTALYTESLYCCLTFGALYFLYKCKSPFIATCLFALSAYTRSNGLISLGYIIFYQTIRFTSQLRSSQSALSHTAKIIFSTCLYSLICLLPWGLYQMSAWEQFCKTRTTSTPPWCDYALPFPYSYVQSKYWEVGFLRYYQLKKIPNFLMAAPTLALVLGTCFLYFKQNYFQCTRLIWSLFSSESQLLLESTHFKSKEHKKTVILKQVNLLPFVLHSLFLALFCLLLMHVEVATRFLHSSSPLPYWALFHVTNESLLGRYTKNIAFMWQLAYCIVGTVMFSNFLPFT